MGCLKIKYNFLESTYSPHTYETLYDEKFRIRGKKETTPDYKYQTAITHDELDRLTEETLNSAVENCKLP